MENGHQKISITSAIDSVFPQYSTEQSIIKSAVVHEFYHAVQCALTTRIRVLPNWREWRWFIEGQAGFIQSVYNQNEEFTQSSSPEEERLYLRDANKYLNLLLNASLKQQSNNFCLYWRFLFEKYCQGSIRERLAIIRDAYRATADVGNDPVRDGARAMDNALSSGGGAFRSFAQSIASFASACYLKDFDPNNVYIEPYCCEFTLSDTSSILQIEDEIRNSFGIDYLKIIPEKPLNATVKVHFQKFDSLPQYSKKFILSLPGERRVMEFDTILDITDVETIGVVITRVDTMERDSINSSYRLRIEKVRDVGVKSIESPKPGKIYYKLRGATRTLPVKVCLVNKGNRDESRFFSWCVIKKGERTVYWQFVDSLHCGRGRDTTIQFPNLFSTQDTGTFTTIACVWLYNDQNPRNDTLKETFSIRDTSPDGLPTREEENFDSDSGSGPRWPPPGWRSAHRSRRGSCWHLGIGGQEPWRSNQTNYACLSWHDTLGPFVYDTLYSSTFSTTGTEYMALQFRTILFPKVEYPQCTLKVIYSIDGGKSWFGSPIWWGHLTNDTTVTWELDTLVNRAKVKIAWVYIGRTDQIRAWCIDDVKVFTFPTSSPDILPVEIVWPIDKIVPSDSQNLWFRVKNYGIPEARNIRISGGIGNSSQEAILESLPPFTDTLIKMKVSVLDIGRKEVKIFTDCEGDSFRENDTLIDTLEVTHSCWEVINQYPLGKTHISASFAIKENSDSIYFWGGKKYTLFYKYLPRSNQWDTLAHLPNPRKNTCGFLVWAKESLIYFIRAQPAVYLYNINQNRWDTLPSQGEKRKYPTACWDRGEYIYVLNGKKPYFRRYHIPSNTWDTTLPFPYEIGNFGRKGGTGIVCDDSGYIYIMATRGIPGGARGLLRYDPTSRQFESLSPLPNTSPSEREYVREMAYRDGRIYLLRDKRDSPYGESWFYEIGKDSWYQITSGLPHPSWRVKKGAALTVWKDGRAHYGFAFLGGTNIGLGAINMLKIYPQPRFSGRIFNKEREREPTSGDIIFVEEGADYYEPKFSPDGDTVICYKEDTSDFSYICKIPLSGGEEIIIPSGESDYESPSYSSDGEWIIALKDDKVVKMRKDGTEVTTLSSGLCGAPVAKGGYVFYCKWDNPCHRIYKIPINGGEEIPLTPTNVNCLAPDPSPTTDKVVYEKFTGGYWQIASLSLTNGEERELTTGQFHHFNPRFSPDGQWIVFERVNRDGGSQICKVREDGESLVVLTSWGGYYETPSFSPDGQWIVCIKWFEDGTAVCKINAHTGEEFLLTEKTTEKANPVCSPNGSYVAYEVLTTGEGEGINRIGIVPFNPVSEREEEFSLITKPLFFALYQNRPNPFWGKTIIRYALPEFSHVRLLIYDVKGCVVRTLVNERQKPGFYNLLWDGRDEKGKKVSAGIYFYRLEAEKIDLTKKLIKSR
ncbi:MAG: FlgD immunoglobulin-like domain containing protein [candidate division WOR-3 bacterium]